jgi:two-component system phosphate regulon response regulator PhoB
LEVTEMARDEAARMAPPLRLCAPRPPDNDEILVFRDIRVDLARYAAWRGARRIKVNPTSFRMLVHFMERPGRVLTRGHLLDALWPNKPEVDARTVDVNIRQLRRALIADGESDPIRTVHGVGYALDDGLA